MHNSSKKSKLILWAYDPFEQDIALDITTIQEFIDLLKKSDAIVQPVYVVCQPFQDLNALKALVEEGFKKIPIETQTPAVINSETFSVAKGVKALVKYADDMKADLIMVSSHGRHGIARMTFGSFAEALLTSSKVPLLFLNHRPKPGHSSVRTALFATDFSKHCERAFNRFLKFSSGICDEVIIYHDMIFIYEMTAYGTMYGVEIPVSEAFIDEQMQWVQRETVKWVRKARRLGFRAKSVIEEKFDVSKSILNEAKTNDAGLIVLASQSGPISSLILGSHARAVFRAGEIPVMAYGPRNEGRQATQPAEQQAL